VLFGLATRFGMMNAQMKSFMDGTGGLWSSGALTGKPAGCFVSVGTQGGGMETTALTFVTQCTHHGMVFVVRARWVYMCARYFRTRRLCAPTLSYAREHHRVVAIPRDEKRSELTRPGVWYNVWAAADRVQLRR